MATDFGSAEVKLRGESILVIAQATMHAVRITDWEAFSERIALGASDEALGATLRSGLLHSRPIPSERMSAPVHDAEYSERLARAFGLSSSRSLYSGMKNLGVEWEAGRISFEPTRNRRGGAFDGFETGRNAGHEPLVIAFDAPDADLGAAIREALRRCL